MSARIGARQALVWDASFGAFALEPFGAGTIVLTTGARFLNGRKARRCRALRPCGRGEQSKGRAGAAPVSEERGADSPARASSSKPSFPLIQKNAHKARHEQRQTDAQDAPHRSCRGSGNARAQRSRTSSLV